MYIYKNSFPIVEKSLVLDMIKTAMNNEEAILQQKEKELKEPVVIPTSLPPSRALTARSEKRAKSKSNAMKLIAVFLRKKKIFRL